MSVTEEASLPALPELVIGMPRGETDIPRAARVYVNRNLRMEDVSMIGFDMDYTLAIYNQPELERLSIRLTLEKLVKRGHPAEILELEYRPEWAIRGLVVDRPHGNVFKMDRHGHVGRVYHGRRALTREERSALYRRERIRLRAPRFEWVDTLFALPEAVMYIRLVEHAEQTGRKIDYSALYLDIRESIDEAHRDDSLKSIIRAELPRFIEADSNLPATLHRLRSAGRRLFLLTNSLWDYTDAVMSYLLDAKLPAYTSWRSYFDIVVVGGFKPAFFTDKRPFIELDPETGNEMPHKVIGLHRGHVYQGGNLLDFERLCGVGGDRVLYIGDHIYGDILRAKKSSVWRTCMIIQELEQELGLSERFADRLRQLDELDRKRRNLEAEIDYQALVLRTLQKNGDHNGTLEGAKKQVKKLLDEHRAQLREVTATIEKLEVEVDTAYNPWWGPLLKEGNENSRFGEQVEDYACLYTSRVSNFQRYSPLRYFRAPRDKMPHEL